MTDLWSSGATSRWDAALARYGEVIERQDITRLVTLDCWYREGFPASIASRRPPHVTHADLVKVTEWKMTRGVWRARNLALVRGNDAEEVTSASAAALAAIPHPTKPIATLAKLAGVGPATASAVVSAAAPETYPFLDELVAAQVPGLGAVAFTLGYYARYAEALRDRAARLGARWTPAAVERALWSNVGGKRGAAPECAP